MNEPKYPYTYSYRHIYLYLRGTFEKTLRIIYIISHKMVLRHFTGSYKKNV